MIRFSMTALALVMSSVAMAQLSALEFVPLMWAVHSGAAKAIWMPSEAMAPTLIPGDRLIARPNRGAPYQRGDVIVLDNVVEGKKVAYVKRIVAVEGDRFEVKDGIIWLNGAPVPQKNIGKSSLGLTNTAKAAQLLTEQLPGEKAAHRIYDTVQNSQGDDTPLLVIPAGHVFVMGDNRDNSADSRFANYMGGTGGPIKIEAIFGKADFIYASPIANRNGKAIH